MGLPTLLARRCRRRRFRVVADEDILRLNRAMLVFLGLTLSPPATREEM
jgi:hypothetical protein